MYYAFIIRITHNGSCPNSIIRRYGCYGRLPEVIYLTVNYMWRNDFFPTIKLDESTQPGWEDAADYFRKRDKKNGTSEFWVPAVIQPQTNEDTPAPPPTTFGELMESLDSVPGISQRPQGTSRPRSSHIRLGSVKPQSKSSIPSGEPAAEPDSSTLLKAKPIEPVSFYPCI